MTIATAIVIGSLILGAAATIVAGYGDYAWGFVCVGVWMYMFGFFGDE